MTNYRGANMTNRLPSWIVDIIEEVMDVISDPFICASILAMALHAINMAAYLSAIAYDGDPDKPAFAKWFDENNDLMLFVFSPYLVVYLIVFYVLAAREEERQRIRDAQERERKAQEEMKLLGEQLEMERVLLTSLAQQPTEPTAAQETNRAEREESLQPVSASDQPAAGEGDGAK